MSGTQTRLAVLTIVKTVRFLHAPRTRNGGIQNEGSIKPSLVGQILQARAFFLLLERPLNVDIIIGQHDSRYEALHDSPFLRLIGEVPHLRGICKQRLD